MLASRAPSFSRRRSAACDSPSPERPLLDKRIRSPSAERRPAGAGSEEVSVTGKIDPDVLELLACPACRATVRQIENEIVCGGCGRRYPIQDGILVMLVEEARGGPASESAAARKSEPPPPRTP
jgi:uncharacterized protein